MKTLNYLIPVLICLLMCSKLNAQVSIDPVKNVYKIGGSAEIFISYTIKDGTHTNHAVLDVSTALDSISSVEEPLQSMHLDHRKTASATGDFNGDGADNEVTIAANENGEIRIIIPLIGDDLNIYGIKEYDISLNEQDYTRIRIIAGNFNHDQQDEFAICYDLPDGTMSISLYMTDSVLNIENIASFNKITYFDRNFDFTAGDVDGDGIDEIVMVRNKATPTWKSPSGGYGQGEFISKYDLYILKYVAGELTMQQESENILKNIAASSTFYSGRNEIINEMRIACGDLNNDGRDEIVVGWSFYYSYDREEYCTNYFLGICTSTAWRYFFMNAYFLNTFKSTGDGIINYQNTGLGGGNPFGTRSALKDQHISMTLKCEQMDNLGGTKVLFNSVGVIYVLGKGDDNMGLKFEAQILPSEGYLNIQGNEAFVVADMNPDIPALNFNKEVIILQSDKTVIQQLDNRYNSKPSVAIVSIDKITDETITFKPPGAAMDIPFSSGENIEISAFAAGDFDLDDAEVFFVGTPVITRVENLQQPIVILNSPPVHFDVFGGEIFDLCNAFNTAGDPAFQAQYITTVDTTETTTITVDKGYGISSDFRSYAMTGGMGFEAALKANWEKGSSFYEAKTQSTKITEAKRIYTEDFVLHSFLNYNYYKYPILDREGKKLADIAVLYPDATFKSAWGSANSWTHPSYVFNHEPGNILSYKQKTKFTDFSTSNSDFISYEYSTVEVTPTGDSGFSFELKDISSGGSSFSYSAELGASLFMKAGIEATVEASLAPIGIGGTIAQDVRMGVSAELSAYYHNSTLSTHTTELSNAFKIEGAIGRLGQSFDATARYHITPYIYRSQSGALVLDYMVNLDTNLSWWKDRYGTYPDLAFILPWRYATEKGSKDVPISIKQNTNDIQFYPPIVNAGDTVAIIARVHNFSLKTFDELLKVDFYLGDPVDGGVKLTNIYGESGSSKLATNMVYEDSDREEYLTFLWSVPDTVSCSPRIYAVIDPENEHTEIHKNNNVGWNSLNIYNCQTCNYVERITGTVNIFAEKSNIKVYPNPFNSHCQIRFSLQQPEAVEIDLYNLAGLLVKTVASEMFGSGEHKVILNAENLDNGIYLCRITTGSYSEIIKLILVR